jgi:GT2 family glycosyltransferase
MKKIRLVSATRKSLKDFLETSALGRSLQQYQGLPDWNLCLFPENSRPLPAVYNEAIALAVNDPALLVFLHDDVYLTDYFWCERIVEGLNAFDVIGLAGNRRRLPRQPSWNCIDENFTWDSQSNLSGAIGHGSRFPCAVNFFGPSGQKCKLLDGVLLAANSVSLIDNDVKFDERFAFDFYDLDFCRQAEMRGLTLGTWPISIIHESAGKISEEWRSGYQTYVDKYGD